MQYQEFNSPPSTPATFLDEPIFTDIPFDPLMEGNIHNMNNFSSMQVKEEKMSTPPSQFGSPSTPLQHNPFSMSSETKFPISQFNNTPPYTTSQYSFVESPQNSPVMQNSFIPEGVGIRVQPERYQVVNYNIYPAPEIEFSKPFPEPVTIQAFLMYNSSLEIPEGFTNGDVQVLKVGQTRVTFPALHLNRMRPVKEAIQQSGSSLGSNFSIKWKVGDAIFFSNQFKLVSACNQIPEGIEVRPRQKLKEKSHKDKDMDISSSHAKPKPAATSSHSGKRRAMNEPIHEEDIFLHVKVRGAATHRGFINIQKEATLKDARAEISKSNDYPANFRFWFEKMGTIVQPHQEDMIKALEAVDGTCLILDPYDSVMENIDDQILSLWLSKKDVKEPLVPLREVIGALLSVYKAHTEQLNDLNIISGGISHFLANVGKANPPVNGDEPTVGIEDFKLFLKYFGPAHECLDRVLSVYREPFFHGFARHSEAEQLLKGKAGYYLIRYSESQLKDGFFAFNVNKGRGNKDVIENYSLRYIAEEGFFVFRNKKYRTLREFVTDSEYAHILRTPLTKTTVETIKESKYKTDTEFLYSYSGAQPSVNQMQM